MLRPPLLVGRASGPRVLPRPLSLPSFCNLRSLRMRHCHCPSLPLFRLPPPTSPAPRFLLFSLGIASSASFCAAPPRWSFVASSGPGAHHSATNHEPEERSADCVSISPRYNEQRPPQFLTSLSRSLACSMAGDFDRERSSSEGSFRSKLNLAFRMNHERSIQRRVELDRRQEEWQAQLTGVRAAACRERR